MDHESRCLKSINSNGSAHRQLMAKCSSLLKRCVYARSAIIFILPLQIANWQVQRMMKWHQILYIYMYIYIYYMHIDRYLWCTQAHSQSKTSKLLII